MRSLLGILLVAAGLSMAVLWMPAYDGERQLAVVTEIATQGMAQVSVPQPVAAEPPRPSRTFSPQAPLVADAKLRPSQPLPKADAAPAATETAALTMSSMTVTVAPSPVAGPQSRVLSSRPTDETGRLELVRNLQRELKRVGCYAGDFDGDWGPASKRAMGSFTELVNASLPYDDPDYILLTLVQGHTGQACGKGCPAGQAMADGKCLPNAIVAQSARKLRQVAKTETDQVRTVSTAIAPEGKRLPQTAMAQPADASMATTAAALAAGGTVLTASILPGRMSIGATRPAEPDLTPKSDPTPATEAVRKSIPNTAAETAEHAEAREKDARDRDRRRARAAAERERNAERARVAVERERSKPRPTVQRDPSPPRQVVAVREQPPRYRPPQAYFSPPPPPRRVSLSRSWTATFFDR
jgi:hypothetical protein